MHDPNTVTFQQVVVEGKRADFVAKVNALLMDDCTVVPWTFWCGSSEHFAAANANPNYVSPGGTVFLSTHFIVLQRTEIRSQEGARA